MNDDPFRRIMGGQFGAVEEQMGQELYQANVDNGHAATEHTKTMTEYMQMRIARAKALNNLIVVLTPVVFAAAVLAVIAFGKWVF